MKHISPLSKLFIFLLFLSIQMGSFAQKTSDSIKIKNIPRSADTTTEIKALKSAINADTIVPFVADKLEKFTMKIHTSNRILKSIIDLNEVNNNTDSINTILDKVLKRMSAPGYKMNLQSANTSLIIFGEIENKTEDQHDNLNTLYNNLSQNNKDIKGIINDPIFKLDGIPDSNLVSQLHSLKMQSKSLDSSETINIAKINYIRSKLATLDLRLKDLISDLHYLQETRYASVWKKEEQPIWHLSDPKDNQSQSFIANIGKAVKTAFRIIYIYLTNKGGIIAIALFLTAAAYRSSYSCKKKLKTSSNIPENALQPIQFLSQNTLVCSVFATLCYFPFFFANPPMSFLNFLQILQVLLLLYLYKPILHKPSSIIWISYSLLTILFCLDNQLLESTIGERLFLLTLQLALIGLLLYTFKNIAQLQNLFSQKKSFKTYLFIAIALAVLAMLNNIGGRVTLSKLFGFTAIQMVVLWTLYNVFSKIVLEYIYIYSEANSSSRLSAFINYAELRNKYHRWLFILCSIAIFIGLTHSLYLYSYMMTLIDIILTRHHTIGAFDFTLYSIFIFIFVIWISTIVSSFVRFALGSENLSNTENKRSKIGSMALLVRLAIWVIGFLIAIAAAGIPIDKITIILSALGVGIGFGLQNIANNLVSGVILAFERPIQVGDSIDISGTSGTVSEIGVRSSKLKISGGADVIIPNGDLLSQKITNWTLTNRSKQEFFLMRVLYGEDLYKIKKLIEDAITKSELVLTEPPIAVSVSEFGSDTIQLKSSFWVRDIDNSSTVRSKLMYIVYDKLLSENIQLPKDGGSGENN